MVSLFLKLIRRLLLAERSSLRRGYLGRTFATLAAVRKKWRPQIDEGTDKGLKF
jgi:hypothetical protein